MIKKAKFFLFSEESKCKKLINKGIAFIYIVLGINAYLLLTLIVLPALRIPVTMPVKPTPCMSSKYSNQLSYAFISYRCNYYNRFARVCKESFCHFILSCNGMRLVLY